MESEHSQVLPGLAQMRQGLSRDVPHYLSTTSPILQAPLQYHLPSLHLLNRTEQQNLSGTENPTFYSETSHHPHVGAEPLECGQCECRTRLFSLSPKF